MFFGQNHAMVARRIGTLLDDAAKDESPLRDIYARMLALHAFYFVEMVEHLARVPTMVGGMAQWAAMVKEEVGEHWTEGEKTRLDFLVAEYDKAVEAAGGIEPIGLATHMETDQFIVMMDDRDEGDDDEEED
jgi:hypothetical protein